MKNIECARALGFWVLVKHEEIPNKSSGGIYLPDDNKIEKISYKVGRVVSTGPGAFWKSAKTNQLKYIHMDVKPGDRVVYRGHLQNAFEFSGYSFISMSDLELVIEESVEFSLSAPYGS